MRDAQTRQYEDIKDELFGAFDRAVATAKRNDSHEGKAAALNSVGIITSSLVTISKELPLDTATIRKLEKIPDVLDECFKLAIPHSQLYFSREANIPQETEIVANGLTAMGNISSAIVSINKLLKSFEPA